MYSQALIDPGSTAPTIGASGAVAGVLGAYALLHPRARILTLIFIIFFVTLVEIPALILLAVWFVLQFIPALGQVAVETGEIRGSRTSPMSAASSAWPLSSCSRRGGPSRSLAYPSTSPMDPDLRNALLLTGLIFCGFFAVTST